MSNRPVLIIEHETDCPPAWLGEWLSATGADLDVRRPYLGDPLPDDLAGHSALVILGGTMDAGSDDRHPWLTRVKSLVRSVATDGTPTLGVCLGHQLIAEALGGRVAKNPRGQQIGVLDVGWQPAAAEDPLFGAVAGQHGVVQWNNDIVTELPVGAVVLARTPDGEVQACRYAASVWGVQWHPEAGAETVAAWADLDRDRVRSLGRDVDDYVAQVALARDELRASGRRLVDRFTALARATTAP